MTQNVQLTKPEVDVKKLEFETVNCPLCSSPDNSYETGPICDGPSHNLSEPYRSTFFRLNRCNSCRVIYQRERLSSAEMDRLYDPDEYMCYQSFMQRGFIIRQLAMFSARKLVKEIESFRPTNNKLFVDYGCGSGSWLELFKLVNAPWDMMGTEISPSIIEHLTKQGFKGAVCTDEQINDIFRPGEVGVFYMHHVIEHLPSPLLTLDRLKKALCPGGIIVGQTPDADCLERRIFKDSWTQWHLPHHLTVFDKKSLALLAQKAGFELVLLKSSPSAATQWSLSILNSWAKKSGRTFRWNGEPLHKYLTLLFSPVSVIQSKVHNTSHVDFILKKKD